MTGSSGACGGANAGMFVVISYCSDYTVSPGLMGFGYSGPDHNEAFIAGQLLRRNLLAFTSHGWPSSLGDIGAISYDCGIPAERHQPVPGRR